MKELYWHCLQCGANDPVEPTGGMDEYALGDHDIAEAWVYGASNFGPDSDQSVMTLANVLAFIRHKAEARVSKLEEALQHYAFDDPTDDGELARAALRSSDEGETK